MPGLAASALTASVQNTSVFDSLALIFEGSNFTRLLAGLYVSLYVALVSMALSIVLGVLLGLAMTSKNRLVIFFTRLYVEFFRLMPQIVLLFVVFFNATKVLDLNISGMSASIIVFTLWGTAEMGDLVRGAITSIPRHQVESAEALALSPVQVQRHVVLPLAIRQLIPQTVNLTTRMIKTTPIIVMIGVTEVLKVSQQIIDANRFEYPDASLWIYGVVFVIYFIICFVISVISRRLEARWAL